MPQPPVNRFNCLGDTCPSFKGCDEPGKQAAFCNSLLLQARLPKDAIPPDETCLASWSVEFEARIRAAARVQSMKLLVGEALRFIGTATDPNLEQS